MTADAAITECDLQAYVDDQLDAVGRLEVADYLVRNPDVAARVLSDLRLRDAMRALAGAAAAEPPRSVADAARRVDRSLLRRRMTGRVGRIGAIAAAVVLSLTVGVSVDRQRLHLVSPAKAAMPVFIEEALMSHRTAIVRSHMHSQPEIPRFDPQDVRSATHISVPRLPRGWRVLDVQLFPSDYGPSLQIVIDAGQPAPISLFAARATVDLPSHPKLDRVDEDEMAYWARAGTVYVLTGSDSARFLKAAADDLSDNQDA